MKKGDSYIQTLKRLEDWDTYLRQESGLPGPRANLELLEAVAKTGTEELLRRYLTLLSNETPVNSPDMFLAICGVVGLGRLLAEGKRECMGTLRRLAADPRWRIREGVAMALQYFGETHLDLLLDEMAMWSAGTLLEQRAAVAALCEPKLLRKKEQVNRVLEILDRITASIAQVQNRKQEEFQVLKKALAYGWSVAAVAFPEEGKKKMEQWFASNDKDVLWIMKENLKKDRLKRMDAQWVEYWQGQFGMKNHFPKKRLSP